MEIAPGYTVADWKKLDLNRPDSADWPGAIGIVEARLRRRFIDPVDVLIAHEIGRARGTFGFAILAIDCVLIETLQGFREGCISHHGRAIKGAGSRSEELIVTFLSERLGAWFGRDTARTFYKECRCAIHHSGQTVGDFRLRRGGPLVTFTNGGGTVLNRTAFHDAIKREVDGYLIALANAANGDLRRNFTKKMNAICGIDQAEEGAKS